MSLTPTTSRAVPAKQVDSAQLLESVRPVKAPGRKPVRVRLDFNRLALRPANENDYEFFFQLKKAAIGDYVRSTWGWDEDQQLDFHFREWRPETLDIITLDIKPIGSMRLRIYSEEVHLGQFYLRPTFQNLGIGSHFLKMAKKRAWQAALPLHIEVLKVNRAREFYERHGFHTYGSTETHHMMEWRSGD